jgi:hypothetical protein
MGIKWETLQQHKKLMLIYEGIYMLEAHNTLFVPQTTRTRNVAVGN